MRLITRLALSALLASGSSSLAFAGDLDPGTPAEIVEMDEAAEAPEPEGLAGGEFQLRRPRQGRRENQLLRPAAVKEVGLSPASQARSVEPLSKRGQG